VECGCGEKEIGESVKSKRGAKNSGNRGVRKGRTNSRWKGKPLLRKGAGKLSARHTSSGDTGGPIDRREVLRVTAPVPQHQPLLSEKAEETKGSGGLYSLTTTWSEKIRGK